MIILYKLKKNYSIMSHLNKENENMFSSREENLSLQEKNNSVTKNGIFIYLFLIRKFPN